MKRNDLRLILNCDLNSENYKPSFHAEIKIEKGEYSPYFGEKEKIDRKGL